MRSLFLTWVKKLMRLAPISSIAMELVRFDLQQSQNPEISGVQYQQGELQGYEVREYLLEKFNRTRKGLPKNYWLDAACVGDTPALEVLTAKPLLIKATGHGSRQMCSIVNTYTKRMVILMLYSPCPSFPKCLSPGETPGVYTARLGGRSLVSMRAE